MKKTIFFVVIFTCIQHLIFAQWSINQLSGEPSIRAIDATGNNNIWISGSNGSILNTTDGGLTWENKCPKEYEHLDFRGIAVLGNQTVLAMSAGDASEGKAIVIKTTDGGQTWKKVLDETQKGIFFDTIKFGSPWTGYIMGDPIDASPYLLKTTDIGETWERVLNLPDVEEGEASFAASNSCITILGENIWFNTQSRIFYSFDSGKNWQVFNTLFLKGASQGIFGIFAIDKYTLIAVGGDYLPNEENTLQYAYSVSGGKSWYTTKDFWKNGLTECIGVFGASKHLISVGTHGSAISKDSGFSWSNIDSEAFHVVKCFGNSCVAAGPNGRVGVIVF